MVAGSRLALGLLAVVGTACSAGVIGGNGASGAFGSATATTATSTASAGETTNATADTLDEDDAGSGEQGSSGTAPAEGTGETTAAAAESSEGAPAECGNDTREGDEVCDGTDLGDATCADFGFDDGVLACDPACSLITDACFTCGDGEIGLGEACDTTNFDGETCMTLGYGAGALLCSADCHMIVEDGCLPLPSCGDGMLNGGEQCDGNQLGGASCVTLGFDLGTLECSAGCTYDSADCMDDLTNCGMMGDFCLFSEDDPQSTCCPAGVGGNIFGLCDVFLCV